MAHVVYGSHMPTTETVTRTVYTEHRFIGKCRICKTVNIRSDILGWTMNTTCTGCKNRIIVKRINGNLSTTECGPKCTGAIGPACDCKCGGENHGAGHL